MKILYIHSSADLYGSDRSLLRLLAYRNKDAIEPLVCIPYHGPLEEQLQKLGVSYYVFNMGVVRKSTMSIGGIFPFLCSTIRGIFRISRIIHKDAVDIVHTNTSTVFSGACASFLMRKPHVWHVREMYKMRGIAAKMYAWAIDHFSNIVVCVSRAVKDHIESYRKSLSKKTVVIHNGIDIDEYSCHKDVPALRQKYNIAHNSLCCATVGRINHVKGHTLFLEIAAQVIHKYPDATFIIAGDVFSLGDKDTRENWRKEYLVKKCIELGIENNVRFMGFVSQSSDIFSLIDVYLFTSIAPDSFPTTLLEAMACGKPLVATKQGGVDEIVVDGESGYSVPTDNTALYEKRVLELMGDRGLRERMGRNARTRCVENFSVHDYCKRCEDLYCKLIHKDSQCEER
ncbi:MAG: glycosyltransferase family 4 protein [Candidatus Ancaeobacter aquaticus]|nr:glycosyltransferase family 4 protein [Candidatus Ancaeobacter aquaticus]